jgi:regulator of protease activity HflC (stomatin/prohibitin superfamily)
MTPALPAVAILLPLAVLAAALWLWRRRRLEPVRSWEVGLLYRDGRLVRVLPPGLHVTFAHPLRVAVVRLPAVEQAGAVGPVDVASADGFAFRLRLSYRFLVADPQAYHEQSAGQAAVVAGIALPGFADAAAAAAMRAAAGRTLAETQADPAALAAAVRDALAPTLPSVTLGEVAVAQLTLPPETRKLLAEVESTRLRGLAQLERARAEQAALRSLANAARLVRDNPELGQLRLLQAVETARRAPTIVLGQPPLATAAPAAAAD